MTFTLSNETMWAIEQSSFEEMCGQLAQIDLSAISIPNRAQSAKYRTIGRSALIEINGVMEKYRSLFGILFGGTSTIDVQNQVNAAAADPQIEHIVLHIDSPGGTVAGTADLADAVYRARQAKPVSAFISDRGASAAYHVASQANQIIANSTAMVGSVGVITYLVDMSALFKKRGLRAIAIGSGKYKAIGAPGTEVSEEQQAEIQRMVDSAAQQFIGAVRRGRGSRIKNFDEVSTARVFRGHEAQQAGLVDLISTFDVFTSELQELEMNQQSRAETAELEREPAMTDNNTNEQNAVVEFDAKVRELLDGNNSCKTRSQAIKLAARKYPELHKRYLQATNPGKGIA